MAKNNARPMCTSACFVLALTTFFTVIDGQAAPVIRARNGSVEISGKEFIFSDGNRELELMSEISTLKSQIVEMQEEATLTRENVSNTVSDLVQTKQQLTTSSSLTDAEFRSVRSAISDVTKEYRAGFESVQGVINASVNSLKNEITDVRIKCEQKGFWVGLDRLDIRGDGVCGDSNTVIRILGFGFLPQTNYSLQLTSTTDSNQKLAITSVTATVDFNNPTVLTFSHNDLSAVWKKKFTKYANVTVALYSQDSTVVPFSGNNKTNVVQLQASIASVDATKKITVPRSQIAYGENQKAAYLTKTIPQNSQPSPTDGTEIASTKLTPMSSKSTITVTASVTAGERRNYANNMQFIVVIESGKSIQVVCGAVEEVYSDTSHFMQSMYVTCVIDTTKFPNAFEVGVEARFSIRAGLSSGTLCNNCIYDKHQKGDGLIMTNIIVQERGSDELVTCKTINPAQSITHVTNHVTIMGHESKTISENIEMSQHTRTGGSQYEYEPKWGSGYTLHTLKIKPTSNESLVLIEGTASGVSTCQAGDTQINVCVYASTTGGWKKALVCTTDEVDIEHCSAYQQVATQMIQRVVVAGTTDETTYYLKIGASRGGMFIGNEVNGRNGDYVYGNTAIKSSFSVKEIVQIKPSKDLFLNPKTFKPLPSTIGHNYFDKYSRKGGSIPWNRAAPTASRGSRLAVVAAKATAKDAVLEIKCQAWMVESYNTADHSTVCLFAGSTLLSCGVEEDTYGQQMLHGCHTRAFHKPGHTNAVTYQCRGGVNGGSADYNGHRGNRMGKSLITQITVNQH